MHGHPAPYFDASFFPAVSGSSLLNFKLILFTQCLSSVGVLYPSPLKTCPRCPPQFEQTISVLAMPKVESVCLVTAPGILSKYAGHPQPDLNLWFAVYRGTLQAAQAYTPSSGWCLSYSPVKGASVPFSRRTRNCSGDVSTLVCAAVAVVGTYLCSTQPATPDQSGCLDKSYLVMRFLQKFRTRSPKRGWTA
jgi:hypothetical protein